MAPTNSTDRAVASSGAILEEAWAWGLDVDAWRGHLHALTWSEVLRQYALAAGWGPRRPRPKKQVLAHQSAEPQGLRRTAREACGPDLPACPSLDPCQALLEAETP